MKQIITFLNKKAVAVVVMVLAMGSAVSVGNAKYEAKHAADVVAVEAVTEKEESWIVKVLNYSVFGN